MSIPTIRPMTSADVEPIAAAMLREHWGDRRVNLGFLARHPQARPFVADAAGDLVGVGVLCVNGPVGWIGTVWVDPEWRRRGVGRAVTQATLDAADAADCRTLVLVATSEGRPLYERLGFEVQTFYRILEAPGIEGVASARVRPFEAGDRAAMESLDRAATGEDRGHLLRAFASPETTRVIDATNGAVAGFAVRAPWGGGATIVPRLDDALAMLDARRIAAGPGGRVRAGLLQENVAGLDRLSVAGWTETWSAPRLVRGEPLDWDPTAIWGQFNFAIG
jgi:ribosomal protein S18 acetylase RimI-like enzyme